MNVERALMRKTDFFQRADLLAADFFESGELPYDAMVALVTKEAKDYADLMAIYDCWQQEHGAFESEVFPPKTVDELRSMLATQIDFWANADDEFIKRG